MAESLAALWAVSACVAPVDLGGGGSTRSLTSPPAANALPKVTGSLTNVVAKVHGDSVGIDFDPVDDAVDYRVYPLPAEADVTVGADHTVTVRNAIYRCAGARQTFDLQNNLNTDDTSLLRTRAQFSWNASIPAEPTLGYVYVTKGPGLAPVYALAGTPVNDEAGWRESRTKIYTTDAAERGHLLAQNWRDDGVVFYVPTTAGAGTRTVYRSLSRTGGGGGSVAVEYQSYFGAGALTGHADDAVAPVPAFEVLSAPPSGAVTAPLMVVGYDNGGHDELAVGKERFARAAHQGAGPLWHLEWSGLQGPTTLVVEALSSGCPYQGFLAADHLSVPPHQPFLTLEDLRRASPTGEVFINGQFDVTAFPNAIARSFVDVAPAPTPSWDFYESFDGHGSVDPLAELPTTQCFNCDRRQSSRFDIDFVTIDIVDDTKVMAYGEVLGQLLMGYDDNAGGTLGKAQFSALQKAQVGSDPNRYLHVGFSTNIAVTGRRFPQLFVSDQEPPVDVALRNPDNRTLVFQARGGPPVTLEVSAVHGLVGGNPWAIDDPNRPAGHALDEREPSGVPSALEPPFEHAGMDRMTKFDLYISSSRFYATMDDQPAGCTVLPADLGLSGPVTVTFGDVFFDEGAEPDVCIAARPYDFLHRHGCRETSRRLDDFGFENGAALPAWDEGRFPCLPY
jgi:hypothetical protein